MKMWRTADEWKSYANCGNDIRAITPPEALGDEQSEHVKQMCHKCNVRPECIAAVVANSESGVWCASEWIPEVYADDSPKKARDTLIEAAKLRLHLAKSVTGELERRREF